MSHEELWDQAIGVLREKGWTRGQMVQQDGSRCALGALSYVARSPSLYEQMRKDLADVIRESRSDLLFPSMLDYSNDGQVIYVYNDTSAKDMNDIIELMEKARAKE